MKRVIQIGSALLVLAVVGWGAFAFVASSDQRTAAPPAARYLTAAVERGAVRQTVVATGAINAVVTVEVGTQLSGQVAEVFADFNEPVTKGEPLAQLDPRSFEARLAEARAATAMSDATVEIQETRKARARVSVLEAEAHSAVLQARLENVQVRLSAAEGALERIMRLRQGSTTSTAQVETTQTDRDSAAAALREAQASLAAHQVAVDGTNVDLRIAEAELANAKASVPLRQAIQRATEIDLERTTIRSPVDGVVVGRNVSEGQTVSASLEAPTLFTIAGDLRKMEIYARIDESDIGKMQVGQRAEFAVDAQPNRVFRAVVTGVRKAPQVVQNVVTYTVVLATDNPDGLLLPGMTAIIRITVAEAESVLKIPLAALRFSPSEAAAAGGDPKAMSAAAGTVVWLDFDEAGPRPASVTVGQDDGAFAVVLDGEVKEGDQVIVGEVVATPANELFGIRIGF